MNTLMEWWGYLSNPSFYIIAIAIWGPPCIFFWRHYKRWNAAYDAFAKGGKP